MLTWLITWLVTHWPICLKIKQAFSIQQVIPQLLRKWILVCNLWIEGFLPFFYGVIYLQNNTVFVILQHGERVEFLCRCSFLEIYNEQIFDLLDPASIGLSLREDLKKGVFVDGLLERDVASARDAYRVGCKNQRKCSENKGNVKIISCSRNTFLWFSIIIIFGLLNIQIAVIIMWWYFIS